MLYTISNVVTKNENWLVVDGMGADGQPIIQASVNRIDRKTNAPFPRFDEIKVGAQIEGEAWTSDAGKQYLFPPRVRKEPVKNAAIKEAMEKKSEAIREFAEDKNYAIKVSSTARDASLIVVALMNAGKVDDYQSKWTEVREWLWRNFDHGLSDVPF